MLSKISFSAFTDELMKIADASLEGTAAGRQNIRRPVTDPRGGIHGASTHVTDVGAHSLHPAAAIPTAAERAAWADYASHVRTQGAPQGGFHAWSAQRTGAPSQVPAPVHLPPAPQQHASAAPAPQAPAPQQAAQPAPQTQSAPKNGGRGGGKGRAARASGGKAVGKLEQAAVRGGTLRRLGAVAAKHPLLAMGGMGVLGLGGGMGAMGMRHPAQQ